MRNQLQPKEAQESAYHIPILLQACLEALAIKPDGVYIDATFGGGGHSKAILEKLSTGKLFAFDQDADAKEEANKISNPNFIFIEANFRYIQKYLRLNGIKKVDGILADLGISSHQIDTPNRGFSTRFDAALDMRMNKENTVTAQHIINNYSAEALHKILGMYGELHNAKTVAHAIFTARLNAKIETVNQLKNCLQKYAPRGKESKFFAQVFQAIRIEVNEELVVLEEFLTQIPALLNPEGRLAVMSFHSLEDRLVKNYIQKGKFHGVLEKDIFGNDLKPLQAVNKKPIEANEEELIHNPRARSAKLRVAELFVGNKNN